MDCLFKRGNTWCDPARHPSWAQGQDRPGRVHRQHTLRWSAYTKLWTTAGSGLARCLECAMMPPLWKDAACPPRWIPHPGGWHPGTQSAMLLAWNIQRLTSKLCDPDMATAPRIRLRAGIGRSSMTGPLSWKDLKSPSPALTTGPRSWLS